MNQREGKVTQKYVMGLNSHSIINICNSRPESFGYWFDTSARRGFNAAGFADPLKNLGTPNVVMQGLESCPGVWLLDDTCVDGLTFVVFSDGRHKHAWKGTSYEVIGGDALYDEVFLAALKRLHRFLFDKE